MDNPQATLPSATEAARRDAHSGAIMGRLAGAVGLVMLVSTPLTWLITAELGLLVWAKLVIGATLVGLYLVTNADFFSRLAGARSTGLMAMTATSVVLVLGLVAVLNYLAYKHPKELDFTKEGLYTLSQQTTDVLGRLQQEVKVLAFYSDVEPDFARVEETLERYQQAGSKLTFEMVNPQSRPDLIEQYGISDRGPRIVVTSGAQDARAKDVAEEELTNAIVKVAEQTQKTVYFLTSHGELDIADGENAGGAKLTADAVRNEGYEVKPLNLTQPEVIEPKPGAKVEINLAQQAAPSDGDKLVVPKDAAVLVIAGPRAKLFAPEVVAIEDYLNRGGRVVVMTDPEVETGLEALMKQWKIGTRQALIVDPNPLNRLLGLGPAAPMVAPHGENEHPITKSMEQPAVLMTARPLEKLDGGEAGIMLTELLSTGETAWGELDYKAGTAGLDDKDIKGPVPVALLATRSTNTVDAGLTPESRLLVVGDSDWVSNKYKEMQSNTDLFLNAVNWLAEEEGKITIRPKARASSQLFLTGEQMGQLVFFSMDILPVLIVAMGLGIVLIRRQR